ncbi:FadR/GntR family transcriptional regulator [Actinomadura physcomitrii]|uniref:FadR/GntR family transcriptional regulator n=1 Tax=Actinomadura physcomitrii TaxID=2650748 RepID=UPI001923BF3E|nr:FCD domain-containing protein [Actinomadura physcomitrii]
MTAKAGRPAPSAARDVNSRGRPHEVKLARRVARRLEQELLEAAPPVGTVYASESELLERFGVSPAVLREAIRLVEHHGLALMRRGPYGGLIVQAPDARPLTNAVVVYLEHIGTTIEDLLGVRKLIEPLAARLAAQNLTEEHIEDLRAALAEERSRGDLSQGMRNVMHVLVGRIGGNRVLGLFVDVLVQLTERYARIPPPPGEDAVKELTAASDHAHERITDAIVGRNAMLAEHRTVRHLDAMREWLLSTRQEPIRSRPVGSEDELQVGHGKQKLAEAVARRLMAEIAASGKGVGEIYGSEAALQARFDVSRAVFREAVRLLEFHSVARMRRGPNGGLVITRPDPSASAEAMAVYLKYERVDAGELRTVRDVIELGVLETLNERLDPALAQRLREANRVRSDTPGDEVADLSFDFHIRLAELTGNPVLVLFLHILFAVWKDHATGQVSSESERAEATAMVAHVHDRILEAVLAGDLPLARHRMHRHLEALDAWWH